MTIFQNYSTLRITEETKLFWSERLQFAVCARKNSPFGSNTESVVISPQSAVRSPQSAVRSPQSAVRSPQSAVRSPKSAVLIRQSTFSPSYWPDWVVALIKMAREAKESAVALLLAE